MRETYFYEAFEGLSRLAPGSERSTKTAISMVDIPRDKKINILDIGCGAGTQTLVLAEMFPNAHIKAIDTSEHFLTVLRTRLVEKGLSERVDVLNLSMFDMDFPLESFDIIWAEGSIYIAGFQRGLKDWNPFLKQEGYLVCSEISWLHNNPANESKEFWEQGYSEMNTIPAKIKQIEDAEYSYQSSFTLPKEDWTEEYYKPLENNLLQMKEKYEGNDVALGIVDILQQEIDLYSQYNRDYSYVFYVMKKR
ncbi:MAG: methyltransferase domain-containing protein [Planococcaceae bacterium]|nr:methyltransferase domain-containing protein [Planococcaceae bacterium]